MKNYQELAKELTAKGYLPTGRYQHQNKGDAVPVLCFWHHPNRADLIIHVSTDELGALEYAVAYFTQTLKIFQET